VRGAGKRGVAQKPGGGGGQRGQWGPRRQGAPKAGPGWGLRGSRGGGGAGQNTDVGNIFKTERVEKRQGMDREKKTLIFTLVKKKTKKIKGGAQRRVFSNPRGGPVGRR